MNKISYVLKRVFILGLLSLPVTAYSVPLRMDYLITDLGSSTYQYDFTLTLDNNDSTWSSGQEWDWIIFGDNDFAGSYNSFDTNGGASGGLDWTTLGFSAPISSITTSSSGHNGPTLAISINSISLPGWKPTAIGDFLSWSGTSGVLIPDGEMRWTSLRIDGGAVAANFELAHGSFNVPEPLTLALMGLGLTGLGLTRNKRCKQGY